jgi:hypothetical protein
MIFFTVSIQDRLSLSFRLAHQKKGIFATHSARIFRSRMNLLIWYFPLFTAMGKKSIMILKEMSRVCKPGGMVAAFAEPDYEARIAYPPELDSPVRLQSG